MVTHPVAVVAVVPLLAGGVEPPTLQVIDVVWAMAVDVLQFRSPQTLLCLHRDHNLSRHRALRASFYDVRAELVLHQPITCEYEKCQ